MLHYFKNKSMFPPPTPTLTQQNLYTIDVYCLYTIYVSGKLGQGGGEVGTIFSKPQKMSFQTPVWKQYTQMNFKIGSRSHNHSQIFASCHLCKLVQDNLNIEIVLTLIGLKSIATNAYSNVDVIACFT